MDAYQQTQHHMRPPNPPPPVDPHQYHHYQQPQQQPPPPPPPIPPVHPQGAWYSNQFHYHPSSQHSPSPPPQWAPPPLPPPPPDANPTFSSSYPPPSRNPSYPAPLPSHGNRFPHPPPSRPHMPPQIPQSYPNQEWGSSNWGNQHAWDDHAAHNMEVDWAAKARAWASAKAAMGDQHPQSQFTPIGRHEEQVGFHEHHPQAVNYPYQDFQQQSILPSNHQHFPVPSAHHRPPMVYMQETSSVNCDASSYLPNWHLPNSAKDGNSPAAFSHQESFSTSSSVHQQEVPSSYSSVAGKEEVIEQKDQLYKSSTSLPNLMAQEGQHLMQPSLPAVSRSVLTEQPALYGNLMPNPSTDLSDQPLEFASGFNHDRDSLMQPGFTNHGSAVAVGPPISSWAPPVVPGAVYPSIPSVIPSGPQQDASVSVSGNVIPPLMEFPAQSFQPTLPSTGAPFGLSVSSLNPRSVFPGDAYGSVSERPRKASVPNWLKEEIIKNASVITKSSMEHPKEDTQSIEDEGVDRSFGNGDQADSKSVDSFRSTEEEDEEDYQQAAKSAAINQEIKRVLTEVLLKVTDELFEEIATKVMDEYDMPVEVDQNTSSLNHEVSLPSAPDDPIPRASAKAVVPVKAHVSGIEVVSEKPSSSSHGNVLGLANYDSDEDDNDDDNGNKELQNSSKPHSVKNSHLAQSDNKNLSGDKCDAVESSSFLVGLEEHGTVVKNLQGGLNQSSSLEPRNDKKTALSELVLDREDREYEHASPRVTSQGRDDIDFRKAQESYNGSGLKGMLEEEGIKAGNPGYNVHAKKSTVDDPHFRETRTRPDQYEHSENKENSHDRESVKDGESRSREDEKQGEHHKRHDEKHLKKEKTNDQNGSKERMKQRDARYGERSEESESRKRSTQHDNKEADRLHRTNTKEGNNKKRHSTNSKEEGDARHNLSSDLSRHKRRRSPSIGSWGRNSKENSVPHAHDSSDDESDNSKRKLHSRRRNLSPSPVGSRRRQLSRSPHSKHSQRRHSPYSSLETNRGRRRSRSRSPMRRKR